MNTITLTHVGNVSGETDIHSCSDPTTIGCIGRGEHSSPTDAEREIMVAARLLRDDLLWLGVRACRSRRERGPFVENLIQGA